MIYDNVVQVCCSTDYSTDTTEIDYPVVDN